ncbi:MAG: Rhomboid-like protein [Proteobacteria bacterium]|nr:Rhomboid-like protein [Pseudomonadota bacterium]
MPTDAAQPARPFTPWLTRALTLANVAVFAAMAVAGVDVLHPGPLEYIEWGSNFAPLTVTGEWWRLATAPFLHFGPVHLLFNAWALWSIGTLVERLFGRARFGAIYAAAGLAGSLASIAWNPLVNSAGASGAVFGIIGAQLAFFTRGGHRIPAEVVRAQRNSTLAFIGYSVTFGFIVPGIDNAAHLGGLTTGFALGWLLARPLGVPASRSQDRAGIVLAIALAAVVAAGGVALARGSAAAHADEQAWLLEWRRYAQAEPAMLAGMNGIMTAARDRRVADADVVEWLETTGIPFYADAAARFAAQTLPPGSPLAGERDRALGFVQRRASALELFANGVRERNRAKVERAAEELSMPVEPLAEGND